MNRKYGNMLNVGAVLTDLYLQSDALSEEICIKECQICIDKCPVNAINGASVNQKLCREYAFGINDRGSDITICNKCRAECPMAYGV